MRQMNNGTEHLNGTPTNANRL